MNKKFNVEEILNNADLIELVSKAGGQIDHSGRGACPIHGGQYHTPRCVHCGKFMSLEFSIWRKMVQERRKDEEKV